MRGEAPLAVIWRRKAIVVGVFLTVVIVTAVASKLMPKVYETDATLLINASSPDQTVAFDRVQASQALARSYAEVIKSPNVAALVAARIPGTTTGYIESHTSFSPVAQTQLLSVTGEDRNAARAKQLADTYATVFIEYARKRLVPTTRGEISLADAAPFPTEAARPKPMLYTLVGALLGLLLGLGLAFLRDRFDRRLRTAADVESRFDQPVLARVPRRTRADTSIAAFRESYRILRTNLQFAPGRNGELDSIAVTSAAEGEGKTTSVVELAIASAEIGQEVIVLEADLRRPALRERLMTDQSEPLTPGLSNYLVETATVDDIIYPTGRPGLSLVPCGPLPPSPAALLEARRGRQLVDQLLGRCDLVLIDCPPLGVAADASIISGWVDGVIMVVDLHASEEQNVRDAMRQLQAVQAPVIGMLLNRDPESEVSSYDYYLSPPKRETVGR